MKKILLLLLLAAMLLTGCGGNRKYQITYLDVFDTVTVVTGMAANEGDFNDQADKIYAQLLNYHRLFDIYNDYDGLNNLKTVNDNAGIGPVQVDRAILDLLLCCRDYYDLTDGRVNVAMGSVLALWHEARTAGLDDPDNAKLPEEAALEEAAKHCTWDTVRIDEDAGTVFLTDPDQKLDVGAVAKGWAVQRVAENLPSGWLLNLGGNVCATGAKDEKGTPWVVGVNDPDGGDYLQTLNLTAGSAVTSGDYQRFYTVDGVNYHHIIDPDTLMPAACWRSVTILCDDSGLADALSTALFLLPQAEGQKLLEQCGAEAMWVDADGGIFYSPGFPTS